MEKKRQKETDRFGETREAIRRRFPSLASSVAFLDNAGGSQMPGVVSDRINAYFRESYVQVGADYGESRVATRTVEKAREFINLFVNGTGIGEVVFGSSTSALIAVLAGCYGKIGERTRSEIIVCESGHEANVGPWMGLSKQGYDVHVLPVNRDTFENPIAEFEKLICEKTRIVAVPHVSNLLGAIDDMKSIIRLAQGAGARVVIDGVAYAPHRAIDVRDLGADFYAFSMYKVFGPHMAALFGTHSALSELEGPNHYFVDKGDIPYKFELGGVLHEGCAGILGVRDYLGFLAGQDGQRNVDRQTVEAAFKKVEDLELPLQRRLINYLVQKNGVRLIGPSGDGRDRVSTISFAHGTKTSKEIVVAANEAGHGIRYGHFYAHRLATALGLDPEDGVVRTSLLHYNTEQEVQRLITFFEEVL